MSPCLQPDCCGDEPCEAYVPSDLWGATTPGLVERIQEYTNHQGEAMNVETGREHPPIVQSFQEEWGHVVPEDVQIMTRQDMEAEINRLRDIERRFNALVALEDES